MKHCMECGHKLTIRHHEHEGMIPYCEQCQTYCFEPFSTAVSLIVIHPDRCHVLLIQQYQRPHNILVAGYINKGECAEEALQRELMEEIGLQAQAWRYLKSEYFSNSNTLMLGYAVLADGDDLSHISEWEIDQAQWYALNDSQTAIRPDSLAQRFLLYFLSIYSCEEAFF